MAGTALAIGAYGDPKKEVAYIYRQGQDSPEEVTDFANSVLSDEEVLPGFEFPLVELNL